MRTRAIVAGAVPACLAGAAVGLSATRLVAVALLFGMPVVVGVMMQWRRQQELVSVLRHVCRTTVVMGHDARVGPLQGRVFVAGIAHPEIYCDAELLTTLDSGELHAVVLHERAHQLARDPMRLSILAVMAPALRRVPSGWQLLQRLQADREIAADRYALERGASRTALASAMLKVQPVTHGLAGFRSATELRIQALLGDGPEGSSDLRWHLFGFLVGLMTCLAVVHPLGLLTSSSV